MGRIYLPPPGLNRVNSFAKMPPPQWLPSPSGSGIPVLDAFALVLLGGLSTFALHFLEFGKLENILKDSLDSIPSPTTPSVKIQIMGGKVA